MQAFTGVKVFSATMFQERQQLGEVLTAWLAANPEVDVVDREVMLSSDNQFHCLSIVLFYNRLPKSEA